MDENNITTNILNHFQTFITTLFVNVKDLHGNAIDATAHIRHLLPAFFDAQTLSRFGIESADLMSDRQLGTVVFYQSLIKYTYSKYSNFNSILIEQIYLKAMSKLPLNIISAQLGLNVPQFNSNYESSEKLIFIVGILSHYHGLSAVDSFLHPLFAKHIFKEQPSQSKSTQNAFLAFPQMVASKGGSFTEHYEKFNVKSLYSRESSKGFIENTNNDNISNSNNGLRWICFIKYQLVHDGPWLQHSRQGRSKKIARLRAIYDIYNYYKRNEKQLIAHCSSQLINNNGSVPVDIAVQQSAEDLDIPVELLYQYDDDEFVPDTLNSNHSDIFVNETMVKEETMSENNLYHPKNQPSCSITVPHPKILVNQLGKRPRKAASILYIPAKPFDYHDDLKKDNEVDDFLVQALLSDFSSMTCDEMMAPNSTSSTLAKSLDHNNNNSMSSLSSSSSSSNSSVFGSPGPHAINTNDVSGNGNTILSSSTSSSTSSVNDSPMSPVKYTPSNQSDFYIKSETLTSGINMEYDHEDRHSYKKRCSLPSNIQNMEIKQKVIPLTIPTTSLHKQHQSQYEIHETKEKLTRQVQLCLQQLPLKDKVRLQKHIHFLKSHPHDAKGYLINLCKKLNNGYCEIKVESIAASPTPMFSAKAIIGASSSSIHGNDEFEIQVVYTATKKTTAEGMAAYTIVSLLNDQLTDNA